MGGVSASGARVLDREPTGVGARCAIVCRATDLGVRRVDSVAHLLGESLLTSFRLRTGSARPSMARLRRSDRGPHLHHLESDYGHLQASTKLHQRLQQRQHRMIFALTRGHLPRKTLLAGTVSVVTWDTDRSMTSSILDVAGVRHPSRAAKQGQAGAPIPPPPRRQRHTYNLPIHLDSRKRRASLDLSRQMA